jgi:hypothetical protein
MRRSFGVEELPAAIGAIITRSSPVEKRDPIFVAWLPEHQ